MHYQRWRKTGDALRTKRSLEPRLWSRIQRGEPDECWPWTGRTNDPGYGMVAVDGRTNQRAHRVLYILLNGPLDDDVEIRHTCDNPPCCNPAHLIPGSHLENMDDMVSRGRRSRKFTDEQLDAASKDPRSSVVVAAEHGMSRSYVLLLRKQYRKGMHRSFTV
jgi:hypothetical protein